MLTRFFFELRKEKLSPRRLYSVAADQDPKLVRRRSDLFETFDCLVVASRSFSLSSRLYR